MRESAGTLLYRYRGEDLEVLLVHPSGNYNRKAPWSIPKGEPDPEEPLEAAARRETLEEAGVTAAELVPLGEIVYQKSRKRVHGFAGRAPAEANPQCASWEVDRAEFLAIDQARDVIHPDQRIFLDRLLDLLSSQLT
jgi:predicted NUDIX family NTP pyrophosphohydrolase